MSAFSHGCSTNSLFIIKVSPTALRRRQAETVRDSSSSYSHICHICNSDKTLSKSQRALKSHQWFRSYDNFTEGVDLAYWWSCIGKGLRLQPAQQACFIFIKKMFCLCFRAFYVMDLLVVI